MGSYCNDCKRDTWSAVDRSSGDTICMECGLVLESHYIDETSEWRTFAANDSTDHDPVRVGNPTNPLLADVPLSASTRCLVPHQKTTLVDNPGRSLELAFGVIATMSDRLGLAAKTKDLACEIFKKSNDMKRTKRKNQNAIFAACLYIACRQEDTPRTVKEVTTVANGADKVDVGRAIQKLGPKLGPKLGVGTEMGTINAADFIRRFCSTLGMTNLETKAALGAVKNSDVLDLRRSPVSVAATIIYMISQLSDNKRLSKEISNVTGVAEATIKSVYKNLYPHASALVPSFFAREEQLKNLYIL